MENKIVVNEFAQEIANRRGMATEDVDKFIDAMFAVVEVALKNESMVKIKGLGSFKLVRVEARESVNISTGQRFTIEGHTKVSFTPDSLLRDQINKPFSEFETVILNDDVDLDDLERIDSEQFEEDVLESPVADTAEPPAMPIEDVHDQPKEEDSESGVAESSEPSVAVAHESTEADLTSAAEQKSDAGNERPAHETQAKPADVNQQIITQHVMDMNVSQQHVEHQTIEPPRDMSKTEHSGHISIWEAMAMALFVVVMMAVSYIAGYNRWMLNGTPVETATMHEKAVKEPATRHKSEADSVHIQASPEPKPQKPKELTPAAKQKLSAEKFTQVEGSEFVIVGIANEHEVKAGESLRGLSVKYYGKKDFVPHILALNEINNPDIIPLGFKLKMPQLEKRIE